MRQTDSPQKPAQSKPTHKCGKRQKRAPPGAEAIGLACNAVPRINLGFFIYWEIFGVSPRKLHLSSCDLAWLWTWVLRYEKIFDVFREWQCIWSVCSLCILERCNAMKMLKLGLWQEENKTHLDLRGKPGRGGVLEIETGQTQVFNPMGMDWSLTWRTIWIQISTKWIHVKHQITSNNNKSIIKNKKTPKILSSVAPGDQLFIPKLATVQKWVSNLPPSKGSLVYLYGEPFASYTHKLIKAYNRSGASPLSIQRTLYFF